MPGGEYDQFDDDLRLFRVRLPKLGSPALANTAHSGPTARKAAMPVVTRPRCPTSPACPRSLYRLFRGRATAWGSSLPCWRVVWYLRCFSRCDSAAAGARCMLTGYDQQSHCCSVMFEPQMPKCMIVLCSGSSSDCGGKMVPRRPSRGSSRPPRCTVSACWWTEAHCSYARGS